MIFVFAYVCPEEQLSRKPSRNISGVDDHMAYNDTHAIQICKYNIWTRTALNHRHTIRKNCTGSSQTLYESSGRKVYDPGSLTMKLCGSGGGRYFLGYKKHWNNAGAIF